MVSEQWRFNLKYQHKDVVRFLEKVQCNGRNSCWIWQGSYFSNGYGLFKIRYNNRAYNYPAHRISYHLFTGANVDNIQVLHQCDVRACINPYHLFLGTQKDNIQDMIAKGRRVLNPRKGSDNTFAKLTDDDVIAIREYYDNGIYNKTQMARLMGMSYSTIGRVCNRVSWKHIS